MTEPFKILVADDRTQARVQIVADGAEVGSRAFTPDELLGLIQTLGQAHQRLMQGRDIPSLHGQRVDLVTDTRWAVGTEQMGEATVLSFQHPAFGPVSFLIPHDQAGAIARRMLDHVQTAKAARARAN